MGAYYSITTCPSGQSPVSVANGVGVSDNALRMVNACGCRDDITLRVYYAQGTCSPVASNGVPFEVVSATDARPAWTVTPLNCLNDQDVQLHWVSSDGGSTPKQSSVSANQLHYCSTSVALGTECEEGLVGYTDAGKTVCKSPSTACRSGQETCPGGTARRFETCNTDANSSNDATCSATCRTGQTCIDPSGNPLNRRQRRREAARQQAFRTLENFCPEGETACPVLGLDNVPIAGGSGECVELTSSLDHCGACNTACTVDAVEGAAQVSCAEGVCLPLACGTGFVLIDNVCERHQ